MRTDVSLGGRSTLVAMAAVTAVWGSWSLSSFVGRMAEAPATLGDLANRQVSGLIPASVVAAAGTAYVTSRLRRRGARDLLLASSRPAWQLSLRPTSEAAAAVAVGWVVYWAVTSVTFGSTTQGLHLSILMFVVCLTSILASSAVGHLVGTVGLGPVSVPLAAVAAYGIAFGSATTDDSWVQGLFPTLGPYVDEKTPLLWFPAEMSWLTGVALLLGLAASHRQSSLPQTHRRLLVFAVGLAGLGLAGVAVLDVA